MNSRHRLVSKLCSVFIGALTMALGSTAALADNHDHDGKGGSNPGAGVCRLGSEHGRIQHVIYIQFDNVHLTRDNPNVPSDLEQMPHLLNFLESNGTVVQKSYTVLISHTAGGITSSLTGLYPDRMGINQSNSYDYYNPATG